jgi:hypothetical protein
MQGNKTSFIGRNIKAKFNRSTSYWHLSRLKSKKRYTHLLFDSERKSNQTSTQTSQMWNRKFNSKRKRLRHLKLRISNWKQNFRAWFKVTRTKRRSSGRRCVRRVPSHTNPIETDQKIESSKYLEKFEIMQQSAQKAIQTKLTFETQGKLIQQKNIKL